MLKTSADELTREITALGQEATTSRSREFLFNALSDGCWIYGAGGYGRTIRRLLEQAGVHVCGFIDRRGLGADGDGTLHAVIARPDEIDPTQAAKAALVLGLHNFAVDQKPVVAWAQQAAFREILTPAELFDLLGEEAGSYWLAGRRHVTSNIDGLRYLWSLLADDASREVIAGIARFRATGRPDFHPASCLADQYFPSDLPPLKGPVTLLDGGAFVGDTHGAALRSGVEIEEWFAFEPAPENFQALTQYAATIDIGHAVLFPCGLSDRFQTIRFDGNGGAGSRAASGIETSGTMVQVVAADEVLRGARPTLVKLDVEGYERQALDGMRAMIERRRPRLAVSVYHEPADLWEIPAKVAQMMPGARLYMRQHGFSGFDTVLYALSE